MNQDTIGIVLAAIGVILQAAAMSPGMQPPSARQGPHRKQAIRKPLQAAERTADTRQSVSARALRFVKRSPVSFVMAIAELSYLVWVATSPEPPSRALVVAVAVIVADLHATVLLWILGGSDRTLGRILDGERPFGEDEG